jgi:hypothetical protein
MTMRSKAASLVLIALIVVTAPGRGEAEKTVVPSGTSIEKDSSQSDTPPEFLDNTYVLPPCKVSAFMGNIDIFLKLLDDKIVYATVTRVTPGSPPSGLVKPDMQIEAINGHWLAGLTKNDLLLIMMENISDQKLSLMVRDDIVIPKSFLNKYWDRLSQTERSVVMDWSRGKYVDKQFPIKEIIIPIGKPKKSDTNIGLRAPELPKLNQPTAKDLPPSAPPPEPLPAP